MLGAVEGGWERVVVVVDVWVGSVGWRFGSCGAW